MHTPVASSSSHRAARLPLPCVFNSDRSSSRLEEKFLFGAVNHPFFLLLAALKSHLPTEAITETFGATQWPLFRAFCCFHPRFQCEIIKRFCCDESAQHAATNISRFHPVSALSHRESLHHAAAEIKSFMWLLHESSDCTQCVSSVLCMAEAFYRRIS